MITDFHGSEMLNNGNMEILPKILLHLTERASGNSTVDYVEDTPLADKCEKDPDSLHIHKN